MWSTKSKKVLVLHYSKYRCNYFHYCSVIFHLRSNLLNFICIYKTIKKNTKNTKKKKILFLYCNLELNVDSEKACKAHLKIVFYI